MTDPWHARGASSLLTDPAVSATATPCRGRGRDGHVPSPGRQPGEAEEDGEERPRQPPVEGLR